MAEFISSSIHVYNRNKDHSLNLEQVRHKAYLNSSTVFLN